MRDLLQSEGRILTNSYEMDMPRGTELTCRINGHDMHYSGNSYYLLKIAYDKETQ